MAPLTVKIYAGGPTGVQLRTWARLETVQLLT